MADEMTIDTRAWLSLPDVAEQLQIRVTQVRQMLRDGHLVGWRHEGILRVPAELVAAESNVAKHVAGVVTVLRDGRFSDAEILRWLYTPDDSLPGRPVDALHGHKAAEVKRRAQALSL